jgi:hypothetical protein
MASKDSKIEGDTYELVFYRSSTGSFLRIICPVKNLECGLAYYRKKLGGNWSFSTAIRKVE